MAKVRITKKVREALDTLRAGEIKTGLELLSNSKGLEAPKAIVQAELGYFTEDYEHAMTNDEFALPCDDQWYAGNILTEHFFAYSNAAIVSNNIERAETFYNSFLAEKETLGIADHLLKSYKHQIDNHLTKLKGEKWLVIDKKPLQIIENGESTDDFIAQLKQYRPKLSYDSSQGAEYLLNFMFEKGNTAESLAYYGKYAVEIATENIHINAARLYHLSNQIDKAQNAILAFVKQWRPVEKIQITPMYLFEFEDLYPLLTPEFKKQILYTPKGNN